MKFALFLCSTFAFAIAVESFWGEGETKNVLEDEPDIDIKAEASIFSSCLICARTEYVLVVFCHDSSFA